MAEKQATDRDPRPILVFGIKGRDGNTPPLALPAEKCAEAVNVDWHTSSLAHKRAGASNVSLTGGTAQAGVISSIFSHVPSDNQSNREFWAIDDDTTPRVKRLVGGTSWADVTLTDDITDNEQFVNAVSFNGKLYFAFNSTVNRLHVWDPIAAKLRRVGLARPAAPTVANTGAGTYAAVLRYYKVCYTVQSSGITLFRSRPSTSVSFTPSGTGTHARVTKPASISEDETHWELYGSPDDTNYFLLATEPVGTTTRDDNNGPSAYSGTAPPDVNANYPPPSMKYLVADDSRVVGTGIWETAAGESLVPYDHRIWWTSPLGATDEGDDERVSNTTLIKNYDDVEAATTGIGGPINNGIYVFSYELMWKMVGTGIPESPYVTLRVNGGLGCVAHKSIVVGEDENGDTALYWWSPAGPMRFGLEGQQRIHDDIQDIIDTVNLSSTGTICHGVFYRDKHQIWWWVATGSSNDPDTKVVFDCRLGRVTDIEKAIRRGWSKHDGPSAAARCSCMMSSTLGATMSRTLVPYIGRSTGTAIWKLDTGTDDAGTTFQAYITTKAYTPWGLGSTGGISSEGILAAKAQTGVTITVNVIRDFALETGVDATALLTASGTETRVFKKLENLRGADMNAVQFQIGDDAAVSNTWTLDAMVVGVATERPR